MNKGFRVLAAVSLCAVCVGLRPAASQTEPAPPSLVRVPFVGCVSDGQAGPLKAPVRQANVPAVPAAQAQKLAYYKAEEGFGVLAPRGWNCFSTYGSSGTRLFVSPDPISPKQLFLADSPDSSWKGFSGPAIQVSVAVGGTSGRFAVARAVARLFPAYMAFVQRVIAEGIEPADEFPAGPFPDDTLTYRSRNVVEYLTPEGATGLGTSSFLLPAADPIRGVVILLDSSEEPSVLQLSARLPEADGDLIGAIEHQLESEALAPEAQK